MSKFKTDAFVDLLYEKCTIFYICESVPNKIKRLLNKKYDLQHMEIVGIVLGFLSIKTGKFCDASQRNDYYTTIETVHDEQI